MKTYRIYQLIDPRNGLPFYVGCTTRTLETRLRYHLADEHGSQRKRIIELTNIGLKPEIEQLDSITGIKQLANCLEDLWMNHIGINHPLVNMRRGIDYHLIIRWDNFDAARMFLHGLNAFGLSDMITEIEHWNEEIPVNLGVKLA